MALKLKFKVGPICDFPHGTQLELYLIKNDKENMACFNRSLNASISLGILKPEFSDIFIPNSEIYVTFNPVEKSTIDTIMT